MEVFVFLKNTPPETLEEIKKVKIEEFGMFHVHKKVKIYAPPDLYGGNKLVYYDPRGQKKAQFGLYGR